MFGLACKKSIVGLVASVAMSLNVLAQDTASVEPILQKNVPINVSFDKGLKFATNDDAFAMHLRFRIQTRFGFSENEDGDSWVFTGVESRVRRARLRLDGHVINKKLEYHIQLSFSRGDMDWDNSGVPNVLRDAYAVYKFSPKFELLFGQTKLPGNRQRVVSSGDQQFVDRSIVNATYNIDRDFLLMLKHTGKLGIDYVFKGSLSGGEGRNSNVGNGGICYSTRAELLPLGKFTDGGDYYESDLAREQTPKLSLAGGVSFNDQAVRTAGQLGKDIKNPTGITVYHSDMLFKYNGISSYTEFMQRTSTNIFPDITSNKIFVHTGYGLMSQLAYLWKNNFELAFRYSTVVPDKAIYAQAPKLEEWTIGGSKYFRKHNVKLQSDLTYGTSQNLATKLFNTIGFTYRIQLQVAI
jgi:hypothetical protein